MVRPDSVTCCSGKYFSTKISRIVALLSQKPWSEGWQWKLGKSTVFLQPWRLLAAVKSWHRKCWASQEQLRGVLTPTLTPGRIGGFGNKPGLGVSSPPSSFPLYAGCCREREWALGPDKPMFESQLLLFFSNREQPACLIVLGSSFLICENGILVAFYQGSIVVRIGETYYIYVYDYMYMCVCVCVCMMVRVVPGTK